MEKPLARNAGLGWIGKHTNLINERAGSSSCWANSSPTCRCRWTRPPRTAAAAAAPACPPARPARSRRPYQLDARRCISYLTIEHHGAIPEELRSAIGNRIFGCDDCQLVCPWNKFARVAAEPDFRVRHRLDAPDLVELFGWSEPDYLARTEGSALRGSASGAGCETSRSHSAMRHIQPKRWRPCRRAPMTPIRSCASTSAGRAGQRQSAQPAARQAASRGPG